MKVYKYSWLLAGLVLLTGCGFDNTMYNARKSFKTAQSKPLNAQGKPGNEAIADYTKTIKKCGYILTERKNSPEADDALYLLAQALYFKGNGQFQAKDQFESLIKNFPNSPYASESVIYIALINRQINQPRLAESVLEQFIRQPEHKELHAKALFVLADFAIQDKDFIKAQYWLDKILTDYPKTKEYKEAFFLSGKLFFEQKDYKKSLEQFQKLTKARGIDKTMVFDAKYYIAMNLLLTGDAKQAFSTIRKLLRDEYRVEKIPVYNVLKGRIWLTMGKVEEGRKLLNTIITSTPKSLASAEAYYWLAEYDFLQKKDVAAAVENYSKAKTESALSPFTIPATDRYAAVNLIQQTTQMNPSKNIQLYLDNNLVIAENYFTLFELPDSVFSSFRRIESTPQLLKVYEDSLIVKMDSLTLAMDSLATMVDTTEVSEIIPSETQSDTPESEPMPDNGNPVLSQDNSTSTMETPILLKPDSDQVVTSVVDSTRGLSLQAALPDSSDSIVYQSGVDSINTITKQITADKKSVIEESDIPKLPSKIEEPDSLKQSLTTASTDSLAVQKTQSLQKFKALRNQRSLVSDSLKAIQTASRTFVEKQIPYSLFVKASMVKRGLADSTMLIDIYQDLQNRYPRSQYTNALRMLLAGEPVRLVDPEFDLEESNYDKALGDLVSIPDSAVVNLKTMSNSTYPTISLKANFRLGWHYTFENVDTLEAKPYLSKVLKLNSSSDYGMLVSRFYDGSNYTFPKVSFVVVDSLFKQIAAKDSLDALKADSLARYIKDDSLDLNLETDSLRSISEADSLQNALKQDSTQKETLPLELQPEIKQEEMNQISPVIKPNDAPVSKPVD